MNIPERGDFIILDFDPQVGHEQMKRRPAIVISPSNFNRVFGLAFVAPISTRPKGHAFEVPLPKDSAVRGSVLVQQLKAADWRGRRAVPAGKAPPSVILRVAEIVSEIVA
jgi:mRNA interferase MazF